MSMARQAECTSVLHSLKCQVQAAPGQPQDTTPAQFCSAASRQPQPSKRHTAARLHRSNRHWPSKGNNSVLLSAPLVQSRSQALHMRRWHAGPEHTAARTSSTNLILGHLLSLSGQHIPHVPSLARRRLGRMHVLMQLLEDARMRAQQDMLAHLEHAQLSVLIPAARREAASAVCCPWACKVLARPSMHRLVQNRQ